MKRRYTPLLFALMLAFFWLSLLLSVRTRTPRASEMVSLTYPQTAGIETLEIELPCSERSHSRIDIRFADTPHVTVELLGIENQAAITGMFARDGKRLVVRPEIRQKPDAANGGTTEASAALPYDDGYWRIDTIHLPMHMRHVKTRGADFYFAGSGTARQHLPTLLVEAEGASSNFSELHIDALRIRNHPGIQPCSNGRLEETAAGSIRLYGPMSAEQLFIESAGGSVTLDNTQALRDIRLHTTPETGIELDRMDAMPRLRWTPLPPPNNGAAPAAGSPARHGPVPSIKAKNN